MFKLSWASKKSAPGPLRLGLRVKGRSNYDLATRKGREQLVQDSEGNNDRYDNDSPMMTMMSLLSGPVGQGSLQRFS